jgi:hypothetical protein
MPYSEYPALIIDSDLVTLYSNIGKSGLFINICNDTNDLRAFIDKYRNIICELPIVLSDLSRFYKSQSLLLKFVEECLSPLLVISSSDCIGDTLYSRFKTIVKSSEYIKNEKNDISLIRESSLNEDGGYDFKNIIKYAPAYYYIIDKISKSDLPCKNKIIDLIL